jgi:hypothetical protein
MDEAIKGEIDRHEYTFDDLDFRIVMKKNYGWSKDNIKVFLDTKDSTSAIDISLISDIFTEDGNLVLHAWLNNSYNDFFTDSYKDYQVLVKVNNSYYKFENGLIIRIVYEIKKSEIEISPYMNGPLTYYGDSLELKVISGINEAKYVRFIIITKDTIGFNHYSDLLTLKNGTYSYKNSLIEGGSSIRIIIYNSVYGIIFLSEKTFVTTKKNIDVRLKRNIYIKFDNMKNYFEATLSLKTAGYETVATTAAKFVNIEKNKTIELESVNDCGLICNSRKFTIETEISNFPAGIYYLYITMGGQENVVFNNVFVIIYDDIFKLFYKDLSNIHECNYYRSHQKYHLSLIDGAKSNIQTTIEITQEGTDFFDGGTFDRTGDEYELSEEDRNKLKIKDVQLNFYEYLTNRLDKQNYYKMTLHLTDISFDCGADECGFCSDSHEIFTTSLTLKNVTCDASDLNFTFFNGKLGHTITPKCSYDPANEKLNCNWDKCEGGYYDIYVEGIKIDFFQSYCEKEEYPTVYLPENVTIEEYNLIEIIFDNATLKEIEHFRTTIKNDSQKCKKYFRPNYSYDLIDDSTYGNFLYDSASEESATEIKAYIYLEAQNIEHTLSKFILDGYYYIDMNRRPKETLVQSFTIPCPYNIVLKSDQQLTIIWPSRNVYNKYKDDLWYKTRTPNIQRKYSDIEKLSCEELNDDLESSCTFNTGDVEGPKYLVVGYSDKFFSAQRIDLITYTTELDTCQELIPNKVLNPLIITLNPPESFNSSVFKPSFIINNTIIDENIDFGNLGDEFTFLTMNTEKLKSGNYSVNFEYDCPKVSKFYSYTFSARSGLTKSYDADFVLRPYIKMKRIVNGSSLYTPENETQTLEIKVESDVEEIPTLIFKQKDYNFTLDSSKGRYNKKDKTLIYDVNLYSRRNELIDGRYTIYYKSACPDDPDIDTGLTVLLIYNVLKSVDKECLYSGDVNYKQYNLEFKYDFEKEWRKPKKIVLSGRNTLDSNIVSLSLNGNVAKVEIKTSLNLPGRYHWKYEFGTQTIISELSIYAYSNKIEPFNKNLRKILQTEKLEKYKVLLSHDILDDQLTNIKFNYYNNLPFNITNYDLGRAKDNRMMVILNQNFTFMNHTGTANLHLGGRCEKEDGDAVDIPIEIIENKTLQQAILKFTRPEPAVKGDNKVEIISLDYEVRDIIKIKFEETDKCSSPNPTKRAVYFCSRTLFGKDPDCNENNKIMITNMTEWKHYITLYINFKAKFQYEYRLQTIWDTDEVRSFINEEVIIIPSIRYYDTDKYDKKYPELLLRDYDLSNYQRVFQFNKGMKSVITSIDFLSYNASASVQNNITCKVTGSKCNADCTPSEINNSTLKCTFTFDPLKDFKDVLIYFEGGTCGKLLYIIKPVLNECSLVSDTSSVTMKIYTENDIGNFDIKMAKKNIIKFDQIKDGIKPELNEYKSDKIYRNSYKSDSQSTDVVIDGSLFSKNTTTYYYFMFEKGDSNQLLLEDPIVKKVGILMNNFESDESLIAQVSSNVVGRFNFENLLDKSEINNLTIKRKNNRRCDRIFEEYFIDLTNKKSDLNGSELKYIIDLKKEIEYGKFTPYYSTVHCPNEEFIGNTNVNINKPDINLTMIKKGVSECGQDECCPLKMVHHIAKESSIFEFTNKYILHSYDLPSKVILRDYKRDLIYTYNIQELTNTNKFSFIIEYTDDINPGVFNVSLIFPCQNREYKYNTKDIMIYKNDIIFSSVGTEGINGDYFYTNYERHFKPIGFSFDYEIIPEQLQELTETVFECKAVSKCNSEGCPMKEDCSLTSTDTLIIDKDYSISGNGLIMIKYRNKRFTKEQSIITIKDKFCQTTKIGIKSKPNEPWPYEISYDKNVCPHQKNTITIKFPCHNYDVNQIKSINWTDGTNLFKVKSSNITYDPNNFLIKFNLTVDKEMIKLKTFESISNQTDIIELDKQGIIGNNNCMEKEVKPNGYILATYSYISNYDYFIYNTNMAKPTVDIEFYSEEHSTNAKDLIEKSNPLKCEINNDYTRILTCNYVDNINGAKRVVFHIDKRCPYHFDIVKLIIPEDTCQYYTKPTKDINFVLSFDPTLEEYKEPNKNFSIFSEVYYDTYNSIERLSITKTHNLSYTYTFQFEPHKYTRWAEFFFYIEKNYTRGTKQISAKYDLVGNHKIIGDVIPYNIKNKMEFVDVLWSTVFVELVNKREKEEIHSMKIYDSNRTFIAEMTDCLIGEYKYDTTTGELPNCRSILNESVKETGKYFVTIVDTCNTESDINEDIYIKFITDDNFLESIRQETFTVNSDNLTTLIYNQKFGKGKHPTKIELIHSKDNKPSTEFGIYININKTYDDYNGIDVTIKTGSKEGLFRIKTTYHDTSVELSDVDIYVGSHSLGFNKGEGEREFELGEKLEKLNITFNITEFNIEQIREIRIKHDTDNRPEPQFVLLPKAEFRPCGKNGITVSFPNGPLIVDGKINLIINDYYYNHDLKFNITYKPPKNFTLFNEVFLVDDQSKEINIELIIQLDKTEYVRGEVENFYIKPCCTKGEPKSLFCEANPDNSLQLKCKYTENVEMISAMNYIIQYKLAEIEINQRRIYINPSIVSKQEYSIDVMNQQVLYTHSNVELEFYIDNTTIVLNRTSSCANFLSYEMFFKEIQNSCPGDGYYDFSVGLKHPSALNHTVIRKILCVSPVDIKNISTLLYSSKPGDQNFEVELNKSVSDGFISNIIFERNNGIDRFESKECTYQLANNSTINCSIDLSSAVQGNYNVYFRYGNGQIERSQLYPVKFLKTYRDIISINPKVVNSYEDTEVLLTFKSTFNYDLVSHIKLIDKDGNILPTKILMGDHLTNPVVYPIQIPKNKFTTGYYTFKVNFIDQDDTFVNEVFKLFILEKQEFTPLPQVALRINNKVTLKIQHVRTTVEIKEIRLCGYTFTFNNNVSTYEGEFDKCGSLIPEFKIEMLNYYLKMDFEFIVVERLTDIYKISAIDGCSYYNLDKFEVSLTSNSNYRINLDTLSVGLIRDNYIISFSDITRDGNQMYKLFRLTPSDEVRKKLLNVGDWKLVISGEDSFKTELYSNHVSFTNLAIPEYVMKGDEKIEFTNVRCAINTPLVATFYREGIKRSITFVSSTASGVLKINNKIPPFNEYGDYDFYIDGCSKPLGQLFVSNTLSDSTFSIVANNLELIQNTIKIESVDYYCKLITKFTINNLGYQKGNQYITTKNGNFENIDIVNEISELSNPATRNLKFILNKLSVIYIHDTYNYQFEITNIIDKRQSNRRFWNQELYYEGPEYVDHIQFISNIHLIPKGTSKNDVIYIPLELMNDGNWRQIKIDNEITMCMPFTKGDYQEFNVKENENNVYVKCQLIYSREKILEFSYQNNPCSIETLILATYGIEGPDCITLGKEELSIEPIVFTIITPHLDKMLDINTKIGQNDPTNKEVFVDDALTYTLVFKYDTLIDSSNYNYQVILNNNEKENTPIIINPNPEEIPMMYKYIDMKSVSGDINPGKFANLTVFLNSPIRETDLPLFFILQGTGDNPDYIYSKAMSLNLNSYKEITTTFNLKNGSAKKYSFKYVNKCDKEVYLNQDLEASKKNALYSVKYIANTTTLRLVYGKSTAGSLPKKVILQEVTTKNENETTKNENEYELNQISSTTMEANIDKLIGVYSITTIYEDSKILEKQQVYLNSDINLQIVGSSEEVYAGFTTNWFELKLSDKTFEGLLSVGYQKYIREGDEIVILEIDELQYVIEPTDTSVIRLNTKSLTFKKGFEYLFYAYDQSSGTSSNYNIIVQDSKVEFEFEKHFYYNADYKSGIRFKATGVTNVYYKSPKKEYYTEIQSIGESNEYNYIPTNLEEIVLLYFSTDGGKRKRQVSEKLYVYQSITDLIKFNTETCIYSKNKRFDFKININPNVQKDFLSFKIGNTDLSESNSVYEYSTAHNAMFEILDGTTVIYEKSITFTDFSITSNPKINNGLLSFNINAECNINSLTVKANSEEYTLTCNKTICECPLNESINYSSVSIMLKDEQIGIYKVFKQIKEATFEIKIPSLILPNSNIRIVISSDNFNMTKVAKIHLKNKNNTTSTLNVKNGIVDELFVESEEFELTSIEDIDGTKVYFTQPLIITPNEFAVISDPFFNIQTKKNKNTIYRKQKWNYCCCRCRD